MTFDIIAPPAPPVIALAGPSAAGKSTWADHLATIYDAPQLRFGEYVAHKARERGIKHPDRRTLQTLGTQLLAQQGAENFCRDALQYAAWKPNRPLIIDGVRHEQVHRSLIHIIGGEKLILLYVDRPDTERLHELANEGVTTDADLREFDRDPTEREVRTLLRQRADVEIQGRLPDANTTTEVLQHVSAAEAVKRAVQLVNIQEAPILTGNRI
jgi:adenylate kinase family enzyme